MSFTSIEPFIVNINPKRIYDYNYFDQQELKHSIWLTGTFDQLYSA